MHSRLARAAAYTSTVKSSRFAGMLRDGKLRQQDMHMCSHDDIAPIAHMLTVQTTMTLHPRLISDMFCAWLC